MNGFVLIWFIHLKLWTSGGSCEHGYVYMSLMDISNFFSFWTNSSLNNDPIP
jgi:hypothetical protein